ncbi:hypothetical protein Hanom_Chr12g01072261 [Helianthus anomalus]
MDARNGFRRFDLGGVHLRFAGKHVIVAAAAAPPSLRRHRTIVARSCRRLLAGGRPESGWFLLPVRKVQERED